MQINNQTAYTYDCIIEFNRHYKRRANLVLNIILGVCSGVMLLCLLLSGLFFLVDGEFILDATSVTYAILIIVVSIVVIFGTPILIKHVARKQAALNTVSTYRFTEDHFEDSSESTIKTELVKCKYDGIIKVTESEHYFYLFINPRAAHIVAKNGFTEGTEQDFRDLLRTVIEAKKLHIQ